MNKKFDKKSIINKCNKNVIYLFGGCLLFLILVCVFMFKGKSLTCTIDTELLTGFQNKEKVVFKLKNNKIKKVTLDRTVSLNDYYSQYGTYVESLNSVLGNGYAYLSDVDIDSSDSDVRVRFATKSEGIVLNNLSIRNNSVDDETSLRFDIEDNLSSSNAFSVSDIYKKSDLKKEVEALGYRCK